MLNAPLDNIKGIGTKRIALLGKLGISTVKDMLFFFPRSYKDFSDITPCAALSPGDRCVLVTVSSAPSRSFPKRGLSIVTVKAHDESGRITMVWYNQPYRINSVTPGTVYIVYGKCEETGGGFRFVNPSLEPASGMDGAVPRGIIPFYPLIAGLTQNIMRQAASACLESCAGQLTETLPASLRSRYDMCELNFAVQTLHNPANFDDLSIARRRLALEEMIFFQLAVGILKSHKERAPGIGFNVAGCMGAFSSLLPFKLTGAQMKVMREISEDMARPCPMNRLVQGDVGSGKTVLALYSLHIAVANDYQGVFLAPTEILARQHFLQVGKLFKRAVLLTGGQTAKEKLEIYEMLSSGEAQVAVGTHALLQETVSFRNLGVIVTDEQHRFGVSQRAAIAQKGTNPDILVMSATPIPRTLSLILYGDLDISVLDELPPGRKPVLTHIVPPYKRDDMYAFIRKTIESGQQAYIVCPLLDQSEVYDAISVNELFEELSNNQLCGIPIALLHGKMTSQEKAQALEGFERRDIKALVSTTVIEVGVDVPNATVIAVEDAGRFGLAQLHQLRGRVGRGAAQSYCFLLPGASSDGHADTSAQRLNVLTDSTDGFHIAQRDLELRGPGEFLGTRQSGSSEFKFMRFISDFALFEEAKSIAESLVRNAEFAEELPALLEYTKEIYKQKLKEIALN